MSASRLILEYELKILEIKLEGTHHRALDDARNIAKIAQAILPRTEAQESD